MNIKRLELSRKYAQAFINIFIDKLSFDTLDNLNNFIVFLKENRKFSFYLSLSTIDNNIKHDILSKVIENMGLPKEFNKLTKLLLKDKRIFILDSVIFYIRELLKSKLNILEFKIITPRETPKNFNDNLLKFLSSKLSNKKILYNNYIDKSLIAGVKAYSTNYLWEHSIKQQLRSLKNLA